MAKIHVTFPRVVAEHVGRQVFEAIDDYIERSAFVGSIARGKSEVHDVDLLVEPKSDDCVWHIKDIFATCGSLSKNGNKMMQVQDAFGYPYLQIDLWLCRPPAQWTVRYAHLTTPADLCQRVFQGHIANGVEQKHGRLIDLQTGEDILLPSERSWFELGGVPYVLPEERDALQERLCK